jgi:hypothetical protein
MVPGPNRLFFKKNQKRVEFENMFQLKIKKIVGHLAGAFRRINKKKMRAPGAHGHRDGVREERHHDGNVRPKWRFRAQPTPISMQTSRR